MGILLLGSPGPSGFSQRSIMGVDFVNSDNQIIFIDHLRQGISWVGPFSSAYGTGSVYNKDLLDTNGWPTSLPNGNVGGGFLIPASTNYAGPYIIDGSGEGRFSLNTPAGSDTWTVNSSTNCTINSDGDYSVTDSGSGWSINVTYSGPGSFSSPFFQAVQVIISTTNPNANGKYLGYGGLTGRPTFRFYRASDAADLAAGKIYRAAYKQMLVDNNPSAIRFMNWVGGNIGGNDNTTRWEYRTTPNLPSPMNFRASPPYTTATFSAANQYTLASATGMPVSYQQGEIINFRCDTTAIRMPPAFTGPSAVTNANPGVATWTSHGFQAGDKIFWRVAVGMTGLDYCVSTIGAVTANTFETGLDTSAQPAWVNGNNSVAACMTMNVGSRGAFPVFAPDCQQSVLFAGANYQAGSYYCLSFDKYLGVRTTPGGALTMGAWVSNTLAFSYSPFSGGVPIELCVALVNEVNAMYTTQGATHLWLNMPVRGMLSVDPDYSAGSNWPINAITAALGGGTFSGTTYAGLTANAKVFLEFSNETWNAGGEGFGQSYYLDRAGTIRNGATVGSYCTFSVLRSCVMAQDVRGAFPGNSRIKLIMGAHGPGQATPAGFNYQRINGNQFIALDAWNTWGNVWQGTAHVSGTTLTIDLTVSGVIQLGQKLFGTGVFVGDVQGSVRTIVSGSGSTWTLDTNLGTIATEAMQAALPPITIHDAVCQATYVSSSLDWNTNNLATNQIAWKAAGKPASSTYIDAYLVGLLTDTTYPSQSVAVQKINLDTYSTALSSYSGKYFIGYEGQWDDPVNLGQTGVIGTVLTQDQVDFLIACKHSDTWKNAWLGLLDYYGTKGNGAMPGQFTIAGSRWGYVDPYIGSTYLGTTENGAFDQVWTAMGTRNQSIA